MNLNKKRLLVWVTILIVWITSIKILIYSVGQSYAKIAPNQFDDYTDAYRLLRSQNGTENMLYVFLYVGIAACIFFIIKSFKKV